MRKNSGYIVKRKDGSLGRTFHSKGAINGKIPVYPALEIKIHEGLEVPETYSDKPVLCKADSLTIYGLID